MFEDTIQHQDWLIDRPNQFGTGILLAHGAGAGMQHDFMQQVARSLCGKHFLVVRFNFDYMQTALATGRRRPPNPMPQLMDCFHQNLAAVQAEFSPSRWLLAGKSMGGRVASSVLNEVEAQGAVCLGYPFHPPKKPDKTRLSPLQASEKPILVVQGTRDALGNLDEVEQYSLSDQVRIHWLEDGDHDLKPRKKSGFTQAGHIASAVDQIEVFCKGLAHQ